MNITRTGSFDVSPTYFVTGTGYAIEVCAKGMFSRPPTGADLIEYGKALSLCGEAVAQLKAGGNRTVLDLFKHAIEHPVPRDA